MTLTKEIDQSQLTHSSDLTKTLELAEKIAIMDETNIGISCLTQAVISRLGIQIGQKNAESILNRFGISLKVFFENVISIAEIELMFPKPYRSKEPNLTTYSIQAINLSINLAKEKGALELEPKHLLLGIAQFADRYVREHPTYPRYRKTSR